MKTEGISTRLTKQNFDKYKNTMVHLKGKFGSSVTVADLIEIVINLSLEELDTKVEAHLAKKGEKNDMASRLASVSEEIRAKIEALLAGEEA